MPDWLKRGFMDAFKKKDLKLYYSYLNLWNEVLEERARGKITW